MKNSYIEDRGECIGIRGDLPEVMAGMRPGQRQGIPAKKDIKHRAMSDLYKNRYRIASARHPTWNYAWKGAYFITICTQNRRHWFGKVVSKAMQRSPIGELAESEWQKTPGIRPDMNLTLGAYVVMPNHFHGILIIGPNAHNAPRPLPNGEVEAASPGAYHNTFGPQRKNVSSVIRGYKSAVTLQARRLMPEFGWQSRFHDHIIRDAGSYQRITHYIERNPEAWDRDGFFSR